jgi:membrane-associated phospholipid phosphatase
LNKSFATILSVVFHPLIITTYLFALLFLLTPDLVGVSALELPAIGSLIFLIFINTFIAPALLVYYMKRFGIISSLHVDHLEERKWPYLTSIFLYAISAYLFGWRLQPLAQLAPQISILLISVTITLIFVFLVSLSWKISAHATGIGGSFGTLFGLIMRFHETTLILPFIILIMIGGFVLSARLRLNAHTPEQIMAGLTGGICISLVCVYFFI